MGRSPDILPLATTTTGTRMAQPDTANQEGRLDEVIAVYLKADDSSRPSLQRQLLAAHPDLGGELRTFFESQERFRQLATPLRAAFSAQNERPAGSVIG